MFPWERENLNKEILEKFVIEKDSYCVWARDCLEELLGQIVSRLVLLHVEVEWRRGLTKKGSGGIQRRHGWIERIERIDIWHDRGWVQLPRRRVQW